MFKKMKLFSKTSMKVLFFLLERPSAKLYERERARKTGASIGAVNGILKLLTKERMLLKEKKGRLYLYEVNMHSPIVRQLKVLINVMKLEGLVDEINSVAEKVTLFGSCAEGTNTQDSDIDLFVLSRDKSRISEAIRRFQRKIGIEIQAIIIEPRELADFRKGNEHIYEQINSGIRMWDANEL